MADRFPEYDVLAKRDTPSWNAKTRQVVEERIALTQQDDVLTSRQLLTLRMLVDRIVPQPAGRPPINTVAILLQKIACGDSDGYRLAAFPLLAAAWRQGLDAIEAEANQLYGLSFAALDPAAADALLRMVEAGDVTVETWADLPPKDFWSARIIPDIVSAYYSHPSAWSAMGFGGPASPRGYVRLEADRRDPWEAAERGDGRLIGAAFRNRHGS